MKCDSCGENMGATWLTGFDGEIIEGFRCSKCTPLVTAIPSANVSFHLNNNGVKFDSVNHPRHYTEHPSGVECITVTEHMNFCIGNAIKYLWRCDHKNGLEDLKKARWYVDREIARREKSGT